MEGNYKEHVLGLQNRRFLLAYENLLSVEDVWLISSFVFYQKSWLTGYSCCLMERLNITA